MDGSSPPIRLAIVGDGTPLIWARGWPQPASRASAPRFQGVDLVVRPQEREHEVGVVHPVGDRLRKREPELADEVLVARAHASDPSVPSA